MNKKQNFHAREDSVDWISPLAVFFLMSKMKISMRGEIQLIGSPVLQKFHARGDPVDCIFAHCQKHLFCCENENFNAWKPVIHGSKNLDRAILTKMKIIRRDKKRYYLVDLLG